MKVFSILLAAVGGSALAVSVAVANVALQPNHPGSPVSGADLITSESLANEAGQVNVDASVVWTEGARSSDKQRLLKVLSAGVLAEEGDLVAQAKKKKKTKKKTKTKGK